MKRVTGELGLNVEQIDQLMGKITSYKLFKRDRVYYGNAEILLVFFIM
ncbi:hypothetical protein [Halalkalibacter flavus]